jgi:hypothetical protein
MTSSDWNSCGDGRHNPVRTPRHGAMCVLRSNCRAPHMQERRALELINQINQYLRNARRTAGCGLSWRARWRCSGRARRQHPTESKLGRVRARQLLTQMHCARAHHPGASLLRLLPRRTRGMLRTRRPRRRRPRMSRNARRSPPRSSVTEPSARQLKQLTLRGSCASRKQLKQLTLRGSCSSRTPRMLRSKRERSKSLVEARGRARARPRRLQSQEARQRHREPSTCQTVRVPLVRVGRNSTFGYQPSGAANPSRQPRNAEPAKTSPAGWTPPGHAHVHAAPPALELGPQEHAKAADPRQIRGGNRRVQDPQQTLYVNEARACIRNFPHRGLAAQWDLTLQDAIRCLANPRGSVKLSPDALFYIMTISC